MAKEVKLYAIYKNNGVHIGNIRETTPKRAVWAYCRQVTHPIEYSSYKAKIAVVGQHYTIKQKIVDF